MALRSRMMNREQIQEMIRNYNGTRNASHSPINRSFGHSARHETRSHRQSSTTDPYANTYLSSQRMDNTPVESSSDEEPNMFEVTTPWLQQTHHNQHLSSNYNHHRHRNRYNTRHQERHHPYYRRYDNHRHNMNSARPKHNENRNEDRPKRVSNRRQQKQYNTQKQHLNTDEFRSHVDNTEHGRNKRMNPQNIQDTRDRNHIQTNTKPDSFYDTQQTTVICTDIKSKPISAPPLQSKDSKISIKEDKSHLDQLNDMKAHVKMEHKHNVQHQEDVMIIKEIKPEVEENVVILKTDEDVVDEMDKDEIMFVKCRENNKTLTGTPCVDLCRVNDPEYILKFCPDAMCKKEFYRSRKDIREKCSIMICREAIHQDWVYWCWNCGHIVPTRYISWSTEPSAMCPGCRAKRRNKTKCKKENIGT
eukprot:61354_1